MKNRLPLVFILITLMLDSRGFGLIVPVMPNLIQELETGDLGQAALWRGAISR